ncbi:hypothetical protein V8G54_035378 [Vigna mungo]|uniref:Uncharacterized protein n=1 Tax=Vigna mungo TaxID=3915 RepID=A0AAQ3MGH3_VIGMU
MDYEKEAKLLDNSLRKPQREYTSEDDIVKFMLRESIDIVFVIVTNGEKSEIELFELHKILVPHSIKERNLPPKTKIQLHLCLTSERFESESEGWRGGKNRRFGRRRRRRERDPSSGRRERIKGNVVRGRSGSLNFVRRRNPWQPLLSPVRFNHHLDILYCVSRPRLMLVLGLPPAKRRRLSVWEGKLLRVNELTRDLDNIVRNH